MVKINRLEVENVKRVQAVAIEPTPAGLTVIGGRNGQGKTSVLDAILWALGGGKHKPTNPQRDGSAAELSIRIELDNGIVVTRSGKSSSLKVLDSHGNKAGQALLDELIGQMAIDLPKFIGASARDKAETLLKVIGVGDQLTEIDRQHETIYNERHAIGLIATRKKKHAEDLPLEHDAPAEEVSATKLIQQQQAILAKNGENQRLRDDYSRLVREFTIASEAVSEATKRRDTLENQMRVASKSAEQLTDESTAELEESLRSIDSINTKVRINATKALAENEAAELQEQYDDKGAAIAALRQQRLDLLNGADLPLPGLSVVGAELLYNGQSWDCMSSADQLRVAVAIARKTRPDCKFVLLDKLEQMDTTTLTEFSQWLEKEGLQVIATRVSTGDECSVIIEDGLIARESVQSATPVPSLTEGGF